MNEIPKDPLLEYILTKMIKEEPESCVKIMIEANFLLKKALERVDELEIKHKDYER